MLDNDSSINDKLEKRDGYHNIITIETVLFDMVHV